MALAAVTIGAKLRELALWESRMSPEEALKAILTLTRDINGDSPQRQLWLALARVQELAFESLGATPSEVDNGFREGRVPGSLKVYRS